MYRALALAIGLLATGCGSRCQEVARARTALVTRAPAAERGADVEVRVPFDRANTLIEALLEAAPLTVPLDVPDLGPLELTVPGLTATAREVRLQAGGPGKIRFATRLEIRDDAELVTTLAVVAEVAPVLERKDGAAELVIGFGPQNLLALTVEPRPDATHPLRAAVARWLPAKLRDRVPAPLLDAAADRLGHHLTGAAYRGLQATLLKRLGELTRLRLRLPEVPVAHVAISSTARTLVVGIATDLAVRRGLTPTTDPDDEVSVRISGSAAAELANWAIDHGHAPRAYDRSLKPRPEGEFGPRFDYVTEDRRPPLKVYAFQDRGGCSYFRVGIAPELAMEGDRLKVTARDRDLERTCASPVLEWLAWMKYFVAGWVDRSKVVAAHTRLAGGGRALETQVVGASLSRDELRFALRFSALACSLCTREAGCRSRC
jgi:hypothetical protein